MFLEFSFDIFDFIKPRMHPDNRHQSIGMLAAGMLACKVARRLGVRRNTIEKLARKRRLTGAARASPGAGRPRVTPAATDQYSLNVHLRCLESSLSRVSRPLLMLYMCVVLSLPFPILPSSLPYTIVLIRFRFFLRLEWPKFEIYTIVLQYVVMLCLFFFNIL